MRILIIEDDPIVALDLRFIVEGEGYEVVATCASVAEARARLAGIDFALLDIDLLDGKSFPIASELRKRGVPFAFVSAARRSELPEDLREARLVPKPYDEASVRRALPTH